MRVRNSGDGDLVHLGQVEIVQSLLGGGLAEGLLGGLLGGVLGGLGSTNILATVGFSNILWDTFGNLVFVGLCLGLDNGEHRVSGLELSACC